MDLAGEHVGSERPFPKSCGLLPHRVDVQSDGMIAADVIPAAGIRLAEKLGCRAGLPFREACRRLRLTSDPGKLVATIRDRPPWQPKSEAREVPRNGS
jgi:hypothetical protein